MKKFKKSIAIFLSVITLAGALPLMQANAETNENIIKTVLDNRSMWNLKKSVNDNFNYSYALFLDLDFDGKPEFIASETAPLSQNLYKFYNVDVNNNSLNKINELMTSANPNNVIFGSYLQSTERFYTIESFVNNPPETRYFTQKLLYDKNITTNILFQKYLYANDLSKYDKWFYFDNEVKNLVNTTESDYNNRYEKYFCGLTNLNLKYKIVEIKYTDSYDTAYEKLKQSLDSFDVDYSSVGDANQDGIVNVNDVTYFQRHIAGAKNEDGTPLIDENDKILFECIDLNYDGKLDVQDITALQVFITENTD